jgi:hypothetical protein
LFSDKRKYFFNVYSYLGKKTTLKENEKETNSDYLIDITDWFVFLCVREKIERDMVNGMDLL